jgi:acetyl esterase/lipase
MTNRLLEENMHFRWSLFFILLLFSETFIHAADQTQSRSMEDIVMMPVVYKIPGMDRVEVRKDLDYKGKPDRYLKMDVYIPPGLSKGSARPAVLFIHGGAGAENTPKDWGIYISWGRLIGASGMVGVTFTHRLGYPNPHLKEAASDVADAIAFVRSHANDFHINKDRICLAAYSAGGPLLSSYMGESTSYIKCLVAFYAFLDVQNLEPHRQYEKQETLQAFSPIHYLDGAFPPLFIARAGRDEIPGMKDSIDRFVAQAISKNAPITFINHPQGVHGFDNQNNDDRSREIVRAAISFMREHLESAR